MLSDGELDDGLGIVRILHTRWNLTMENTP